MGAMRFMAKQERRSDLNCKNKCMDLAAQCAVWYKLTLFLKKGNVKMACLVVFDVDGTLLKSGEKRLCGDVVRLINKIHKNGCEICFASGRSFYELINITEELDFEPVFISNDGAYCFAYAQVLYEKEISSNANLCLFNLIKGLDGVSAEFCTKYFSYVYGKEKFLSNLRAQRENQVVKLDAANEIVQKVYKVTVFFEEKNAYAKSVIKRSLPNGCRIVYESDEILEVVRDKAEKYNAVLTLKENSANCTVVAIGDGENDINMLKNADYAIAPANAAAHIKNICNVTVKNISEIEKILNV